jgi:hypothetical protein
MREASCGGRVAERDKLWRAVSGAGRAGAAGVREASSAARLGWWWPAGARGGARLGDAGWGAERWGQAAAGSGGGRGLLACCGLAEVVVAWECELARAWPAWAGACARGRGRVLADASWAKEGAGVLGGRCEVVVSVSERAG